MEAKWEPKGTKREPKDSQREAKECQKGAKIDARTHQTSMRKLVAKRGRKIMKHHVFFDMQEVVNL